MTLTETFRALFPWRQPRKPEPDRDEPCSDYDPAFSANPYGPGFHPSDRAQGRGGSRFNPFRSNGE